MSLINFLRYGPSHPSFNDFHANTSLRRLEVIPNPYATSHEAISTQPSNFSMDRSVFHVNRDNERLFTVNFAALDAACQTWEKFRIKATYIRDGSAFLSLASLGTLYWKYIPGNSWRSPFNLIMAVAASALAGVALVAQYRKSEIPSVLAKFPSVNTLAQQICDFRNYLLNAASNRVDNPFEILNPNLESGVFEFFTQDELSYLFTDVLFVENGKLTPAALYLSFPTPIKTDTNCFEGQLIEAYNAFRKEVDFNKMQEEVESLYQAWARTALPSNLSLFLEPGNIPGGGGNEMLHLFSQCYREKMPVYCEPSVDQYYAAFGAVCLNIGSKLRISNQAALDYLHTQASADFKDVLYGPDFVQNFEDVVAAMNLRLEDKNAQEWLKERFNTLNEGHFKKMVMASLDLNEQHESSSSEDE